MGHPDVCRAGQRQVTFSAQETHTGRVYGHQRCGTCGVHADSRPAQVQLVGHPGCQEILVAGQHQPITFQRRPRPETIREVAQEVGVQPDARVDADGARVGFRIISGVLQRREGAFKEMPLLRVQELRLLARDAEDVGVEHLDAGENLTSLHIAWVRHQVRAHPGGQQLVVAEEGRGLAPRTQVPPEFLDRVGTGKTAGHADDRDICFPDIVALLHRISLSRFG